MITSKHINKIVAVLVCFALLTCGLIVYSAELYPSTKVMAYEEKLFGDEIVTLEIKVDPDDWQNLLDNPSDKEFIPADLTINGETFVLIGVRTKGNSSLSQVKQMSNSNRYSLNFKFDKYQKGQNYYGLDTFCINNMISDYTYMKDYLAYDIMNFIGVPTPLMNYAQVTVNGEDYGFCLLLERYDKAFLDRAFETSGGQLYNVKTDMGQQGNNFEGNNIRQDRDEAVGNRGNQGRDIVREQMPMDNFNPRDGGTDQRPSSENPSEGDSNPAFGEEENRLPRDNSLSPNAEGNFPQFPNLEEPDSENPFERGNNSAFGERENQLPRDDSLNPNTGGNFPQFPNQENEDFSFGRENQLNPGGAFGSNNQKGGSLVYIDDQISSYSNILNNAKFKKNSDIDKARVIKAIKNLNEGTDLEKYFDVDEILRYLAAHTVVVNLDSYSSSMAQNYYIYELNGKISILPWDYNFAFGGFQGGDADSMINFPIDTPVSGVSMEDRPLISKLLEIPEYLEKYHDYLNEIVENYFNSGLFEETIAELDGKINEYVKNDTTAFVSYEKYIASLPILTELGLLRAKSVEGQLNGTIPSTTEGQAAQKDTLIKSTGINLSDLGSFGGGEINNRQGMNQRKVFQEEENNFTQILGISDELSQKIMKLLAEDDIQPTSLDLNLLSALELTDQELEELAELHSFSLLSYEAHNFLSRENSTAQTLDSKQSPEQTQKNNIFVSTLLHTDSVMILLLLFAVIIVTYLLSKTEKRY